MRRNICYISKVALRIFENLFYKSPIRACSFGNSLAASQNARSYGQTSNHRALRICKKGTQKLLMLPPCLYNKYFFSSSFCHIQLKAIEITKGCFLFKFKEFLFSLCTAVGFPYKFLFVKELYLSPIS